MPHYHRIENVLPQLQQALHGMELTSTQDANILASDELQTYDGVLVFTTGAEITDDQFEGLHHFIHTGKALIGVHNATDTWKNNARYIELIGGKFITHPAQLAIKVEVVDPNHPITQGLAPFDTWDELYIMETYPSTYHTLLETHSYEDIARPLAWVKEHGQGRIFYTALGHEPVERPDGGPFNLGFHELLRRGTLWAVGQL